MINDNTEYHIVFYSIFLQIVAPFKFLLTGGIIVFGCNEVIVFCLLLKSDVVRLSHMSLGHCWFTYLNQCVKASAGSWWDKS